MRIGVAAFRYICVSAYLAGQVVIRLAVLLLLTTRTIRSVQLLTRDNQIERGLMWRFIR